MPVKFCCRMPDCSSNTYHSLRAKINGVPADIAIGRTQDAHLITALDSLYVCTGCSTIFANPKKFSLTPEQQKERGGICSQVGDIVSDSMSHIENEESDRARRIIESVMPRV